MAPEQTCFATLLTTDSYLPGALTLASSLRSTHTSHEIVCLVADGQLAKPTLERLEEAFDRVIAVPMLDSHDARNLALLGRPDLGATVTKISIWALVEYDRVAFLDADTLVLQPVDSLLEPSERDFRPNGGMLRSGLLAAAPDLGWPDCFNSGVFVARPSRETHRALLDLLAAQGSFDGGDQGLLNAYFSDWSRSDPSRRLPFSFNATSTTFYTYAPAFARFASNIRVAHFIGTKKPWLWDRTANGLLIDSTPLVDRWWAEHDRHVSGWTADKGPFNKDVAFSTAGYRRQPGASDELGSGGDGGRVWEGPRGHEQGAAMSSGAAEGFAWGEFTPAPDFVLARIPRSPEEN